MNNAATAPGIEGATIYAVSSGAGRAGVAVLRLSGPAAAPALRALAGRLPEPQRATLVRLRDPESRERIDRGLVLYFPAPASFSGEDMAELHVHGSRAVLARLLAVLARLSGLRPAEPGEFTRRAFENGKLDLAAVEGLIDLIDAETEAQRRQALRQMEGALGRQAEDWRERLLRTLALVEAEIDFVDEADVPESVGRRAAEEAAPLLAEIRRHLADVRRGERIRDGIVVVIAGPPNAGKSTLLNALARREVAIVSAEAGTTRDVIEVRLDLASQAVTLLDTAGLREAESAVEREGVRRALERAERADLVLWLEAADADPAPPPETLAGGPLLRLWTKCDLAPGGSRLEDRSDLEDRSGLDGQSGSDRLDISARTGEGIPALLDRLSAFAAEAGLEPALVTRERQRLALQDCADALARVVAASASRDIALELVAEDLRLAARALGRLTGRVDVEDLLDVIFREFCIGK